MVVDDFNPDTSRIESLFTGLRVEASIASGGQKIVYVADHAKYGKVALKLIRPGSNEDKERILREISASEKLIGPQFSHIYAYGDKPINGHNILYILEEFLDGKSLREVLQSVGKMALAAALEFAEELLAALVVVHSHKIVHRDLKPENVFLTNDDRVVLLDFGIARHLELSGITRESAPFGPLTPGYAAPEQIRNEQRKITCRTDLFQFGIVLYECLTGANPFIQHRCSVMEALKNNLELDPAPLYEFGFSRRLSHFVETCLQKHPHRRYADPHEALVVLKKMSKGVS